MTVDRKRLRELALAYGICQSMLMLGEELPSEEGRMSNEFADMDHATIILALLDALEAGAEAMTRPAAAPQLTFTLREAKELVGVFGGDDTMITVRSLPEGAVKDDPADPVGETSPAGLWAHFTEMPEEGCLYLGPCEVDDGPAVIPFDPAAAPSAAPSPAPAAERSEDARRWQWAKRNPAWLGFDAEDEYTIVLVCRALIVRTEALREIAAHAEFRAHDEDDASCLRGQLVTIGEAARKALAEEP